MSARDAAAVAAFRRWLGPRRRDVLAALTPEAGRSRRLGRWAEAVRAGEAELPGLEDRGAETP